VARVNLLQARRWWPGPNWNSEMREMQSIRIRFRRWARTYWPEALK
jgi:hypothetical protein